MNKADKKDFFSNLGKKGGKSTVKKYGKEHMAKIGRKGAFARIKVLTKKDL